MDRPVNKLQRPGLQVPQNILCAFLRKLFAAGGIVDGVPQATAQWADDGKGSLKRILDGNIASVGKVGVERKECQLQRRKKKVRKGKER